jgi:hypothetical protein
MGEAARTRRDRRLTRARVGVFAGVLVLLACAGARAAVFDFEGELVLEPLLPSVPSARISGVGVATLNGSGAGAALTTLSLAGGITGTTTVPVTDPIVSNGGFQALQLKARVGSGRLRPFRPPVSLSEPQLSNGRLPVHGLAHLCFFAGCQPGLDLPLTGVTLNGPVGLGIGGVLPIAPLATLRHSLHGAPWTVRTASLALPTPSGSQLVALASGVAHGPLSFTGSTASPGGVVSLVTPLAVESLAGLTPPTGFARLTLRFVPEPHASFLLAPSIALLAMGARRRRRRGGSS